jgi:8-oxo-dGTP pyrophosphatase MutT (NUDIX family)
MVRRALEHGHIIGSASDRTIGDQKKLWEEAGIEVSFTINKHRLTVVREQFEHAEAFYHIGDTDMDKHYAVLHGFEFLQVQTMEPHAWMLDESGEAQWGPHGRGVVPDHAPAIDYTGDMQDTSEAFANG